MSLNDFSKGLAMTSDGPHIQASTAWSDDPDALAREAGDDGRPYGRVPVADLDRVILALEGVDWSRVPGVSVATVAMFASLLREAREKATGRRPSGGES